MKSNKDASSSSSSIRMSDVDVLENLKKWVNTYDGLFTAKMHDGFLLMNLEAGQMNVPNMVNDLREITDKAKYWHATFTNHYETDVSIYSLNKGDLNNLMTYIQQRVVEAEIWAEKGENEIALKGIEQQSQPGGELENVPKDVIGVVSSFFKPRTTSSSSANNNTPDAGSEAIEEAKSKPRK